ncbi:MAG TPA: glycosyl transferase [Deltaproteobacteria bacterium]|nr:glycosyl transferase [Deltaproteobacteria bacterium]
MLGKHGMPISILIPAYNEEQAIAQVITQLKQHRPQDEILVIDDASTDRTSEVAKMAGAHVVRHRFNLGYGGALKTGIRKASHETLVFFDADDQFYPEDIEILVRALDNADMAVGERPQGSGALGRRSGKWFLYKVANYLVKHPIPDLNCGLRALRREWVLNFLHLLPNGFSLTTTLTLAALRSGFQVEYLPIRLKKRETGKSRVSPKDFFLTMLLIVRMITLFAPLRIFLPTSAIFMALALPSLIHDLITWNITDTTVLLWMMSVVIFFFGLLADTVALVSRQGDASQPPIEGG